MLKNPIYYGVIRYGGELYDGKHEPIITKKLFDSVQEVMKRKSKPKGRKLKYYVYRGFFRCGECGCFITTETQKGHNYLRCTKRKKPCSQRYVREEIITSQIKEEIKKVSLSSAWVDACVQELEKERTQKKQAEGSFALKLRNELVEIEQKLDSLLDLQLSGALSQDEYVVKKTKLLNQKTDIAEKISASKQKSDNRFEPLIRFLKATNQAEKIALQENPEQGRDFLKKIGSNYLVRERALSVDLKKPWRVAQKWHLASQSDAPHSAVSDKSENWRRGRDSNPRYPVKGTTVFETVLFNHSSTPPRHAITLIKDARFQRADISRPPVQYKPNIEFNQSPRQSSVFVAYQCSTCTRTT